MALSFAGAQRSRLLRQLAVGAIVLAAATCSNDQGPSTSGRGYLAIRPTFALPAGASFAQFGISADSIRILLTRPVNVVVLDTTVDFPADSGSLKLALPIHLEQSPETLDAVVEIHAGGQVIFVDTVQAEVKDGPPGTTPPANPILTYVGPGKNIGTLTIAPPDTTVALGDTLFFTATAKDSSNVTVSSFYVGWSSSDTTLAKINAQGRLIVGSTRGTVKVVGVTPTGIADTTTLVLAPVPVIITRDSGNAQTGLAGDSLALLIVARVKGADSLGIAGIPVRFTAVTAGGAIRDTATLYTDANGRVRTRAVLGTGTGSYSYSAAVVGTPLATTFTATANPNVATAIAIQGGNNQTDSAGRALATAFTVRIADAFNNPVTGAKVYWTRTVGTGTVVPDSSLTNGSGIATANYTLGAVGADSIKAQLAGTSAFVTFGATAINGAVATLTKTQGDLQTDTVGQQLGITLAVVAKSATNQPVVGVPVVFTVLRGGHTSLDTAFTGVLGAAAVLYTLDTIPGTDSVQAQAGAITALFTETALTGAPANIVAVAGDAQTDTAGRTLATNLQVHVTDTFGNDVLGVQVAWQVLRGGNTGTDTTATGTGGLTSNAYTLGLVPGVDSIQAKVVGTGLTVLFTENVQVLTASQLLLISGDAQTDTVARVLLPMVVEAEASDTRPVDSTTIQWSIASGSGFLAASTTLTDSTGRTSNTLTLPVAPGSTTILAILPGHDTVSFTATSTPDAPTSFTINSGAIPQSDTVDAALAPYTVQVTDSFGNPRPGLTVVWSRVAGSGTATPDTVTTIGGGLASFGYTLGGTAGADTVRATLLVTGATLDFTATTLAGLPDSIIKLGGDAQTDTVGHGLAVNPSVKVIDRHGNGVPTTPVAYVVTGGGGTPSLDTSFTDLTGFSATGFTLGTTAGAQSFEARARNGAVVATFTATAVPALPSVIAKTGGDGQADTANAILPTPLSVHVTDAYGNNIAGTAVAFAVSTGGGLATPDTAFTDTAGVASATLQLGSAPGTSSVQATLVGTPASVVFTATILAAAPANLQVSSGDGQTDTVTRALNNPLIVRVEDAGNNGVPGVPVYFSVILGSGSPSLSADTVVTDSLGYAATALTLGTATGTVIVQATTTTPIDTASFTAVAVHDAPTVIALTGGSGQAVEVLHQVANSLFVQVSDAFGNTVDSTAVLWSVPAGSGTASPDTVLTSGGGTAAATYLAGALIGHDTVRATIAGTAATVDVMVDVYAAPPLFINTVSGDSQSSPVGTPFAAPLVVHVTDSLGNPTYNAAVAWAQNSGENGNFSSDTVFTDSAGQASVTYTPTLNVGGRGLHATVVASGLEAILHGTALPAAAGVINIFGGNNQSDTVRATATLPLTVQVSDSFSNLVSGTGVTWKVISGSAHLADSIGSTDSIGTDSTFLTFGDTAGAVVVYAILANGHDTVAFNAIADPGQIASFVKVSGDLQTGIVSSPVALPLVARLADAYGNGVPNYPVTTAVDSGGGTIDSADVQTDASGLAHIYSWTLGPSVGGNGVSILASGMPTLSYTAIGLPLGTSKSWAGTASSDWNDPNNWAPTGVPLATEGVYLPSGTPTVATLTSAASVAALTLQTGAMLETNGYTLTASGDVRANYGIFGTGTLEMSGSGTLLTGTIPNLLVTGTVTLASGVTVSGNIVIDGGQFDLDTLTAIVSGGLTTQNGGTLRMASSQSILNLLGGATFAGGDETGLLTGGNIYLAGGNFVEGGGAATAFVADTNMLVQFAANALQTISFQHPAASHFGRLQFVNSGSGQFLTDASAVGDLLTASGPVTGAGLTVTLGRGFTQIAGQWQVGNTIFTGSPSLSDTLHTNVTLLASTGAGVPLVVTGDLTVRGAGTNYFLAGAHVGVLGNLLVDSGATVQMTFATDSLGVAGDVTFAGASSTGLLTNGVLSVGRNFAQAGSPTAYAPSGNHLTLFPAAVAFDSVGFANPGLTASHFHHVTFLGGVYARYSDGNVATTGITRLDGGANFNVYGPKYTVSSALPHGDGLLSANMLEVAGNVVADTDAYIPANVLRITGASSTLDINGHAIYLGADLDIRSNGLFKSTVPGGSLAVSGKATFGGRSTLGQLTAGDLYLSGDFTQAALTNTRSFQASGSFVTHFIGANEQLVTFGSPGATSSRFQELDINGAGVTFGSLAVVNGSVTDNAGPVQGVVGVNIAGDLSDPGFNWHPATTTFSAPSGLPDSLSGSIVFTGPYNPLQPLKVIGSLTISGPFASFNLDDNPHVQVTDSFVTELGGTIDMTGSSDTLDIGGNAYFTGNSFLGSGAILVRGNFEQAGNTTAYDPQPGFVTILAPTGTDTVTFANPDSTGGSGSGFAALILNADGQRLVLATPVEVRGTLTVPFSAATDPVLEGNGNRLTVRGAAIDGLTLDRTPLQIHETSSADALSLNDVVFSNFLSSDIQLRVSNPGNGGFSGSFNNMTFTPLSAGATGYYVEAQDADGTGPSFNMGINPPHPANGPSFTHNIGIASVLWL